MAQTAQINIKVDSTQANNSVGNLNEQLNNSATASKTLKGQLRAVQEELARLDVGSKRFKELSIQAGQLKDQIKDAHDVISATAGSAVENLGTALSKTTQIGIAGFQGLLSIQALYGIESEELTSTLVKLNAVAGLADAVKTLGELPDTLTQIKASATAAAQAMGFMTVATEAETVATEAATVATEGLNTTMKANPIGLIIVGITALVGIYAALTSVLGKTTDNTKKLAEQKKRLNEEAKKQREFIGQEVGGYAQLVAVLSQTKNGTKERQVILENLNKTYGTHLKNIKDEQAFQKQLNQSVEDYIEFKTYEYAMMANEEKFKQFVAKKYEAQKQLSTATKAYNDELAKQSSITTTLTVLEINKLNDLKEKRDEATYSLTRIDNTLKYLQNQAKDTAKELSKFNIDLEYTKETTDKTTKSTDSLTDAFDRNKTARENLADITKFLAQQEAEYQKVLLEQGGDTLTTIISNIELEKEAKLVSLQEQFDAEKKLAQDIIDANQKLLIEKKKLTKEDIQNETDAKKQIELLEKELGEKTTEYTEIYNARKIKATNEYYDEFKKRQKEILEATLTRDEFKKFEIYLNQYTQAQMGYTGIIESSLLIPLAHLKTLNSTLKEANEANKTFASEEERLLDLRTKLYKNKGKVIIDSVEQIKKEFNLQGEVDDLLKNVIPQSAEMSKKLTEALQTRYDDLTKLEDKYYLDRLVALQVQLDNGLITQKEWNDAYEYAQEQHNDNLLELDIVYGKKSASELSRRQKERFDKTKDDLDKQLTLYQSYFNALSSTLSNFTSAYMANMDAITSNRMTQIEDVYNKDMESNEQALTNKSITQEEYDKKRKEIEFAQEQEQKSLRRREFFANKRLSMAQATIDGASAVLSTFAGTPGGIIIKTIAASLAGLFAAAQIVAIEQTQFTGAKGGVVPQNGKSSNMDSVPSMLAPGEAVINSNSSSLFPELLNLINMAGGGKNLLPNGAINSPTNTPNAFPQNNMGMSAPIRAYVVESDITSSQDRVNRIKRTSEF